MKALCFVVLAQVALSRFEPAERGSSFFVADDLAFRSPAIGATLAYGYKPLVVLDPSGAEQAAPVRHQAIVHTGGSFVVAKRIRAGIDVPVAIYQDGERGFVDGVEQRAADKPAMGDVRLAADVKVFDGIAAGVRAWLPTGVPALYTSDGVVRVAPQVLTGGTLDWFVWGTRVAYVIRDQNEFVFGGGAGARIDAARLFVGVEVSFAAASDQAPGEWLLGARHEIARGLRVALGGGGGFSDYVSSPKFRGVFALEWVGPEDKPVERPVDQPPPENDPWKGYEPPPPLARVTETEIAIREQIQFAVDSAELVGDGGAVLPDVQRVLETHPEIAKIRIEGHTDSTGDAAHNEDLSKRRAETVVTWLVAHGVDASRLEAAGYGSSKPIASNDTEEGRAQNRRVVFVITERR